MPYRRKDRPEIVELTGQSRVPVLIDGDEVVHDSKRIIQYLDGTTRGESDESPRDGVSTI